MKVLKEMIFPLIEKVGQTIIFVRTRETARELHNQVRLLSSYADAAADTAHCLAAG